FRAARPARRASGGAAASAGFACSRSRLGRSPRRRRRLCAGRARKAAVSRADDYRAGRAGAWRLRFLPARWSEDLQQRVLALAAAEPRARHPRTVEIDGVEAGEKLFLKIFHRAPRLGAVKDIFRPSKSFRFWRQSLALAAAQFHAPTALAAGELRRFRAVQRGFVVTETIAGRPLPEFLAGRRRASARASRRWPGPSAGSTARASCTATWSHRIFSSRQTAIARSIFTSWTTTVPGGFPAGCRNLCGSAT